MKDSDVTYRLGDKEYEVIKPIRLKNGKVLKSDDTYARIGPKEATLEEQIHTVSLFERGFPVPKVLESGEYGKDEWYFTEQAIGDEPFHHKFCKDTEQTGFVSDSTFKAYLAVVSKYMEAQVSPKNRSSITSREFVESLLIEQFVLSNYCYFGFDADQYRNAINKVVQKLHVSHMGIIQHDLNPFNILEGGVIDFELVGYGPIGYDVLMSARWGGTWFTSYSSRYPSGYSLTKDQISENDDLVKTITAEAGYPDPAKFIEEFLLLKTAWAVMEYDVPQADWPQDRIAFRRFRSNLLNRATKKYLNNEPIDYWNFSNVSGGEV